MLEKRKMVTRLMIARDDLYVYITIAGISLLILSVVLINLSNKKTEGNYTTLTIRRGLIN